MWEDLSLWIACQRYHSDSFCPARRHFSQELHAAGNRPVIAGGEPFVRLKVQVLRQPRQLTDGIVPAAFSLLPSVRQLMVRQSQGGTE